MAEFRLSQDHLKRLLTGKANKDKTHFSTKALKEKSEQFIVTKRLPIILVGNVANLANDLFPFMSSEILGNMKVSNRFDYPRGDIAAAFWLGRRV